MQHIVICGAAGRDFHNFNTVYRDNSAVGMVAFTAHADFRHRRPAPPIQPGGAPDLALTQAGR